MRREELAELAHGRRKLELAVRKADSVAAACFSEDGIAIAVGYYSGSAGYRAITPW